MPPRDAPPDFRGTDLLVHLHAATRPNPRLDEVMEAYGAQLGEMLWHSVHHDPRVEDIVAQHATVIRSLLHEYRLIQPHRPVRILEVGAYCHYTVHQVAAECGGVGFANDISPSALRQGAALARRVGLHTTPGLVASDFHDLPFSSGYFDLVFIASAVHHTFRPWQVLAELFRVLRPGGILHLENEPVGRLFSLYQFRSNRPDRLGSYERAAERLGLLRVISSPFTGSRDEELFGMIENERIPLDTFLDAFAAHGQTLALTLDAAPLIGPVEQAALALPRDENLPAALFALLREPLREAAQALSENDLLMGFSAPRREDVWRMCYATASALRTLPQPGSPGYGQALARIMGAALRATLCRGDGPVSDAPLRRPLALIDDVQVDVAPDAGIGIDLQRPLLPVIETTPPEALAAHFPATSWIPYIEAYGGQTLLTLGAVAAIDVPATPAGAVLLLRCYAVLVDTPYMIRAEIDGAEAARCIVVQSETQLLRVLVPAGAMRVTLWLAQLDGSAVDTPHLLHLAVAQMLPFRV